MLDEGNPHVELVIYDIPFDAFGHFESPSRGCELMLAHVARPNLKHLRRAVGGRPFAETRPLGVGLARILALAIAAENVP